MAETLQFLVEKIEIINLALGPGVTIDLVTLGVYCSVGGCLPFLFPVASFSPPTFHFSPGSPLCLCPTCHSADPWMSPASLHGPSSGYRHCEDTSEQNRQTKWIFSFHHMLKVKKFCGFKDKGLPIDWKNYTLQNTQSTLLFLSPLSGCKPVGLNGRDKICCFKLSILGASTWASSPPNCSKTPEIASETQVRTVVLSRVLREAGTTTLTICCKNSAVKVSFENNFKNAHIHENFDFFCLPFN